MFSILLADGAGRYLYSEHSRITAIRAVLKVIPIIFTCRFENTEDQGTEKPFYGLYRDCTPWRLFPSMLLVCHILQVALQPFHRNVSCFPPKCASYVTSSRCFTPKYAAFVTTSSYFTPQLSTVLYRADFACLTVKVKLTFFYRFFSYPQQRR